MKMDAVTFSDTAAFVASNRFHTSTAIIADDPIKNPFGIALMNAVTRKAAPSQHQRVVTSTLS
jgi:hypothetical protein